MGKAHLAAGKVTPAPLPVTKIPLDRQAGQTGVAPNTPALGMHDGAGGRWLINIRLTGDWGKRI